MASPFGPRPQTSPLVPVVVTIAVITTLATLLFGALYFIKAGDHRETRDDLSSAEADLSDSRKEASELEEDLRSARGNLEDTESELETSQGDNEDLITERQTIANCLTLLIRIGKAEGDEAKQQELLNEATQPCATTFRVLGINPDSIAA